MSAVPPDFIDETRLLTVKASSLKSSETNAPMVASLNAANSTIACDQASLVYHTIPIRLQFHNIHPFKKTDTLSKTHLPLKTLLVV
jgi:hypothetical protein